MASIGLAFLLYEFRGILILLLLAILVSAALRPAVLFLVERLGISRSAATIATYLSGLLIIILILVIPASALVNEFQSLFNDLATTYEARFPDWQEGSPLEQRIAAELPPPDQFYQSLVGPVFGQQIMGLTRGLLGLLGGTAVIFVLSIYWTIDQARLERYWLSLLPADWRVQARRIWREVETGVGGYFRSELIQSLTAVILLTLFYWLFGIQFPLVLATIAAIAWLIPLVGVVIAVLPILLIGLFSDTIGLSILSAVVTILVLSGIELFVEPRLFNRRTYNSTLTVLLMLVLVEDFGLVGLVMAPPLAAALQIFFNHALRNTAVQAAKKPEGEIGRIQQRYETLIANQVQNGDALTPTLENLGDRLAKLLVEAKELTGEA